MKTILVIFGGCSTEYEVSLHSAAAVLAAIDRTRYVVQTVGITREGRWLYYTGPVEKIETDQWRGNCCTPCALCVDRDAPALVLPDGTRVPFDLAFPVLHGKNGEDGTVQGLLELTGVPLVGCGTLGSALGMDKNRAHTLVAAAGVAVPRSALLTRSNARTAPQKAAKLGYPVFVKPVRAGSSFGITRVDAPDALQAAVEEAFYHDSEVLLEETISGFEVGCAVMGNEVLTVGAVDEIELHTALFDYTEKYTLQTAAIHCPARITPQQAAAVQQTAQTIYRALGCRGFARVDCFLTPQGRIVFNEVNTIPGFTAHSRFPKMMEQIGYGFPVLVQALISLAEEG